MFWGISSIQAQAPWWIWVQCPDQEEVVTWTIHRFCYDGPELRLTPEGQWLALTGTLTDFHYPVTRRGCPFFESLGSLDLHEIRLIFLSLRRVLCCFHELELHILARRIVFIATEFVTNSTCQIVMVTYYACSQIIAIATTRSRFIMTVLIATIATTNQYCWLLNRAM